MNKRAKITAVGSYLPEYILTNKEIETMMDTTDEWIVTRSGISERRILKDKDKASAFMGAEAVSEF
jgi:3-oxoacyl-[acyl-carrier-protein] synthase-3